MVYRVAVWPLKALRHACYFNGSCGPRYVSPIAIAGNSILWLGFLALLIWFANRHVPQVHEALVNLPSTDN